MAPKRSNEPPASPNRLLQRASDDTSGQRQNPDHPISRNARPRSHAGSPAEDFDAVSVDLEEMDLTDRMKVEIERVTLTEPSPEDRASVNEVLMESPNATVFHTVEWNRVLTNEFGLQNVTFLATTSKQPAGLHGFYIDGSVCRSPVTHLESVYGGPISTRDHDKVVVELLKEGNRLQRVALFHMWTPANYDISPLIKMGYSSREMYKSILSLQKS